MDSYLLYFFSWTQASFSVKHWSELEFEPYWYASFQVKLSSKVISKANLQLNVT